MTSNLKITGFVKIIDVETGEILLEQENACHYENLSVALAQSIISGPLNAASTSNNGFIYTLNFGNGGTTVSSSGIITYNPPQVIGSNATLYNQTYSKIVNNNYSANLDPTNNYINVNHVPGKAYTDIIVNCQLDYGEPNNQTAFDNSNSINAQYAFDEMGLFDSSGLMLTHLIYSPILKSSNRQQRITYTLRIATLSSITV